MSRVVSYRRMFGPRITIVLGDGLRGTPRPPAAKPVRRAPAVRRLRRWSQLEIEYIGECFHCGDSISEIARAFRVRRGLIAGVLFRNGYLHDDERRERKWPRRAA